MTFAVRPQCTWHLRTRRLDLGRRTLLMGILNVTPDSFSDGGLFMAHDAAVDQGLRLLDAGADVVDIGGESTRPGANPVSEEQEQSRILPVVGALIRARPEAIVSVDTYHASTAERALEAGAEIVNDVSGLLWDPAMAGVLASGGPGAVLMHTRGAPRLWSGLPGLPHDEILPLVISGLARSLQLAEAGGINRASIVLDPGFGFGKRAEENFVLLARMAELQQFNLPLLAGISRKRFLTARLVQPTDQNRRDASVAANVAAVLGGAHILRVHDVAAARVAADIGDALLDNS
jgi:dihydropteroate synthase